MNKICTWFFIFLTAFAAPAAALSVIPGPDEKYTAIHRAAEECDIDGMREAFEALDPVERIAQIDQVDREGYTPLAYAARNSCLYAATLLIDEGATVDKADEFGRWTPLLHAAQQNHAEMTQVLLTYGANPNVKTPNGKTPLLTSINGPLFRSGPEGDRDATLAALLAGGADVNLAGEFGRTPLIAAVIKESGGIARLLLALGADATAKDVDGRTAFDHARERGVPEFVEKAETATRREAIGWFEMRAKRGGRFAPYQLAALYAAGRFVTQDYAKAAEWYLLSAEHGYAKAQVDLANLYSEGQGVERNYKEAYFWYTLAIAENPYASALRDAIQGYLTKEEIRAALDRAAAWKAKT